MLDLIWLIPLLPLLSALAIFFFGRWMPMGGAGVGIAAVGWGLLQSLFLLWGAAQGTLALPYESAFTWFRFAEYEAEIGFLVDGLTIVMLVVVTSVSFLVQVYSLGYMHGDPRFKRYYAYLSLFTASMLSLVVANNMLQFFASWELVGVCSYLLISFWFEKPEAAYAGKKAFMTTKLGDLGFFIGLLVLFDSAGTLRISQMADHTASGLITPEAACVIALLFFLGAVGKSAQVPLFIWLPDAMEGPTPVSALIHAATMVAAGVYLVARTYFLYVAAPVAMETVAWFGAATAFLAATMALVVNDIKRVLAFSTVSQLGFMMLGLGVGGLTSGMFHLTTHGFFKALLFLGAGSVIHAVHTNDMREMGGLKDKMPVTYWTMLAATLAISGIPPFAGFFSKDDILADVASHSLALYLIATFTAGLTAFYMFRLVFMTFHGEPRDPHKFDHAHESPAVMTGPLVVLAVLSVVSGMAFKQGDLFASLVPAGAGHGGEGAHHVSHALVAAVSTGVASAGILLSYLFFMKSPGLAAEARERLAPVHAVLEKRYGLDAVFLWFVSLGDALSRALFWFDYNFIDQLTVDGYGYATLMFSRINGWLDRVVVDGAVDGFGSVTTGVGSMVRSLQTGLVQNYLLYIAAAVGFMATLMFTR